MLHNLLTKFKSNRINFANYYEKEFYSKRFLPMCLLQVGVDNTIPVWKKYLQRCNIYCIDSFDNKEPKSYGFLNDERILSRSLLGPYKFLSLSLKILSFEIT